jgi:carboxypeptidase Taq
MLSAELGAALEEAAVEVEDLPYDSDEASLVRVARRERDKACRVPADLRAEIARATSLRFR